MLTRRIIPCLDVKDGRVVKGVKFQELRDAGDPVESARAYGAAGADELCFLDISASLESRGTLVQLVERVALELAIPFAVGGGVRGVADAEALRLSAPCVDRRAPALALIEKRAADHRLPYRIAADGDRNRSGAVHGEHDERCGERPRDRETHGRIIRHPSDDLAMRHLSAYWGSSLERLTTM